MWWAEQGEALERILSSNDADMTTSSYLRLGIYGTETYYIDDVRSASTGYTCGC